MTKAHVRELMARLDGSGSDREWAAVNELRRVGDFPQLLLEKYGTSRTWQERASCLYHAARYAAESTSAYQLGVLALGDRSAVVRYRAALLLAVSQNAEALGPLRALAESGRSVDDANAAIAAIVKKDANLFVDRDGSGKVVLNVH